MKVVSQRSLPAVALCVAGALFFTGCGTPGAPMPPSLKLPDPVADLSASRTGDQVSLTWIMPRKSTDKLLLKGNLPVQICRKEGSGTCQPVTTSLLLAPDAHGAFTETLSPPLAAGPPRSLTYFVELKNHNGRSAGLSNPAVVLAGEAPAPVAGLSAQVRKDGVVLHWTPGPAATGQSVPTVIRLHRKLLTPQHKTESGAKPQSQQGILAPSLEPLEQSLLVDSSAQSGRVPDRALDKEIRLGQTYEYRAQRVARVTVGAETLELGGPLSDPVRVEALDVFPPAVPAGLAAVATAAGVATEPSIDLSWQPVTDADLAGYLVYRRQGDAANGTWQRISPPQPFIGPVFHDAHVQPGHTYRYAVSAIDQLGHESARSAETEETVPGP